MVTWSGHLTQNNTLIYDRHGLRSDRLDRWTAGHWSEANVRHEGFITNKHINISSPRHSDCPGAVIIIIIPGTATAGASGE